MTSLAPISRVKSSQASLLAKCAYFGALFTWLNDYVYLIFSFFYLFIENESDEKPGAPEQNNPSVIDLHVTLYRCAFG